MKTTKLYILATIVLFITLSACQKDVLQGNMITADQSAEVISSSYGEEILPSSASCNSNAYSVTLESCTQAGANWEWIWSVQNPNPGNGNGGTVQDLSHWGMQFGPCFNWSSVVGAAYSSNGSSWTSFTPSYSVDPSQSCLTTPVLKFDFGTSGSAKSYYKLVLNAHYPVGDAPAYYKSGKNTGCCTFTFAGVGCEEGPER